MPDNTGRLSTPPRDEIRHTVYGHTADASIDAELWYVAEVDRAHLVMLAERGLVERDVVARVLWGINELVESRFEPLRDRPASRGLYFLYEGHLVARLGAEVGGHLRLGKSRNDLGATVMKMRLRRCYLRLLTAGTRLLDVLSERGQELAGVMMPAFTHGQVAVPVTLGHYFLAIALGLSRDLEWLAHAFLPFERCPLGAGAVGGTSVPIDHRRTAELLGFRDSAVNSIDAVAARDEVPRVLGAASCCAITLSRMAQDLFSWSSGETGFIHFPDRAVGSSSMMPQKRNPFPLEHIKGRTAGPLGALAAATCAMHSEPYSNSIAVGTEAVGYFWQAAEQLTDALVLTRVMVEEAEPRPDRMRRRAHDGLAAATVLAESLACSKTVTFLEAHRIVGEASTEALASGEQLGSVVHRKLGHRGLVAPGLPADLDSAAERLRFGAAASPAAVEKGVAAVRAASRDIMTQLREREQRWSTAAETLRTIVGDQLSRANHGPGCGEDEEKS